MEVHNCTHCGTETQPNWRFCRRCGTALEKLDQQPAVASCSNCAGPIADGWRFCPNCGTATDGATPAPAGLSSDEVADLLASSATAQPPGSAMQDTPTATGEAPPESAPPDQTGVTQQEERVVATSARTVPAAVPERVVPEIEPERDDDGPTITGMDVSYEPVADTTTTTTPAEPPPTPGSPMPPLTEQAALSPPAPPLGSSVDSPEESASFESAAPPPPRPAETFARAATEEVTPAAEAKIEPAAAATKEFAVDRRPSDGATAASAAPLVEEPAVHIPPVRRDTPRIRREVPRPIGATPDLSLDRPLPRPISDAGPTAEEPATPATRPQAALPDRPKPTPAPVLERPPIDGRTFQNPGLMGQGLQLALLATASIAVGMIVGLIVLNNRLDSYATTGEQLNRVESAESIINSWLRPLLAVAVLATYVLFVVWARRVVRNLSVFEHRVPETALWMWVIPIVNIYLLHQHMDRAWKGADAYSNNGREWMRGRHELWNVAFAVLVIAGFGLVIYAGFLDSSTFEASIDANALSMVGYGILSASLLSAVRAVGSVIGRQQTGVARFD